MDGGRWKEVVNNGRWWGSCQRRSRAEAVVARREWTWLGEVSVKWTGEKGSGWTDGTRGADADANTYAHTRIPRNTRNSAHVHAWPRTHEHIGTGTPASIYI